MVAYSFKAQFAEPIITLKKRQTVRGNRARHARSGEPIQLYTAMRTKHCRKLLDRDPICLDVRPILIDFAPRNPRLIARIEIEGCGQNADEMEAFAISDGFGTDRGDGLALYRMGLFWLREHGAAAVAFDGVVIRWEPTLG